MSVIETFERNVNNRIRQEQENGRQNICDYMHDLIVEQCDTARKVGLIKDWSVVHVTEGLAVTITSIGGIDYKLTFDLEHDNDAIAAYNRAMKII